MTAKMSIKNKEKKNAPAQGLTAPHGDLDCKRNKKKIFSFEVEVYPNGNLILFIESTQAIETGEKKIKTLHKPSPALAREIERAILTANAQHKLLITCKDSRQWEKIRKRTKRDQNLSYLFVK